MRNKDKARNSSYLKPIIIGIIIVSVGAVFTFMVPKIWDWWFKRPVAPIQFVSSGGPLWGVIRKVEGETDYDVIASKEVEWFQVYGKFEGKDWIQVLTRILRTYDKELKFEIDEKKKKIKILLKKSP